MQQLVSGLAADHEPIGNAISGLAALTDSTAGLLEQGRQPLKDDIAALGEVSRNLADSEAVVDGVLRHLPGKVETITRTATYGSWFNFFLCEAGGSVAVSPIISQPVTLTPLPVTQSRCRS